MSDAAAPPIPPEPWLETIEGDSPFLLIAPHGGRAGPAALATLHPKVNDLHTAEITRHLAQRLGASALINAAMDRNLIDCNRIAQIADRAPWILEMIAERLAGIVDRFGRATVLLIHGWNIIEPRIDFGLGVRRRGGELHPAGSARVSASDEFINGPLALLAERLRKAGIAPTFGMRYPAGGINNLVQAFTERHRDSEIAALRRISSVASEGRVDTAQLELSVSVRLPGDLRRRYIEAMTETFHHEPDIHSARDKAFTVVRAPRPIARSTSTVAPQRVGVEFYDASSQIGAMASFDVGTPGFGARIMMIVGERRVVLCTCEGTTQRDSDRLSLGPLSLAIRGDALALDFAGPAVVVPDSSKYLSIEQALATGSLDATARVSLRIPIARNGFDPAVLFAGPRAESPGASPVFSIADGEAHLEGRSYSLRASARAGVSFTGLGPQTFVERRMIWAMFDSENDEPEAIELRRVDHDDGPAHHNARIFSDARWSPLTLRSLAIETQSPDAPPHRLEASATGSDGDSVHLSGSSLAFVPLSRPGPNGSRIYTTLGFGTFSARDRSASGMFEYSRRIEPAASDDRDSESDSD